MSDYFVFHVHKMITKEHRPARADTIRVGAPPRNTNSSETSAAILSDQTSSSKIETVAVEVAPEAATEKKIELHSVPEHDSDHARTPDLAQAQAPPAPAAAPAPAPAPPPAPAPAPAEPAEPASASSLVPHDAPPSDRV